jgi:AbiV family abortive infection protein
MKPLTVEQLEALRAKVLENASELLEEAELLFSARHFARALVLASIALEELSKLLILGGRMGELQAGLDVDWKSFYLRFRNHEAKLKQAKVFEEAILSRVMDAELEHGQAVGRLSGVKAEVKKRNALKNACLYVEAGAVARKPSDVVSEADASEVLRQAQSQLSFFQATETLRMQDHRSLSEDMSMLRSYMEEHGIPDALLDALRAHLRQSTDRGNRGIS